MSEDFNGLDTSADDWFDLPEQDPETGLVLEGPFGQSEADEPFSGSGPFVGPGEQEALSDHSIDPVESAVVVATAPVDGGGILDGLAAPTPVLLGGGAALAAYWLAPAKYRFTLALAAGAVGFFGGRWLNRNAEV